MAETTRAEDETNRGVSTLGWIQKRRRPAVRDPTIVIAVPLDELDSVSVHKLRRLARRAREQTRRDQEDSVEVTMLTEDKTPTLFRRKRTV
jgi:hypothetical protein